MTWQVSDMALARYHRVMINLQSGSLTTLFLRLDFYWTEA